ncbi:hypothetical protein [Haloechinothrix halophila]|uniref:hypothetical protein n=1 Tax=Haloechinothrix halophila TaxID=1069073 RepID=UPI0003F5BE08|nr:hypothetical protein [Haloechinothrix halophila]
MTSATDTPIAVRRLNTQTAQTLTDLASIFNELQTVLRCCERLVTELAAPRGTVDDLVVEGLWTTALLSYSRCFTSGDRGQCLTESDVAETELQGEVLEWHKSLRKIRKHCADPVHNPRERFDIGVAQDDDGRPMGIAITSTPQPALDDRTVRQTGAIAYALSQLVDKRITEHQEKVYAAAQQMPTSELNKLARIEVAVPEQEPEQGDSE